MPLRLRFFEPLCLDFKFDPLTRLLPVLLEYIYISDEDRACPFRDVLCFELIEVTELERILRADD